MTKNNLYHAAWKLRATGALVLALALSAFPAAFSRAVKAQTPAQKTAQTPAKTTTSPATESKGGPNEGIKVHGYWMIDVRNPDGKLVTHREFENALLGAGATTMQEFLGRAAKPGLWQIGLARLGNPWVIGEPSDTQPFWVLSKNLSLCLPTDASCIIAGVQHPVPLNGHLLIGGSVVAPQDDTIFDVTTYLYSCPLNSAGGACANAATPFTDYTLTPLVNGTCPPNTTCRLSVVAGQIIQVTVQFSFS